MTLSSIQAVVDGLDNNKVANFSYTDNALNNDDVNGVSVFDLGAENNIPNADNIELNQTLRNKGFRSQTTSIPRGALNHFWGRVSYNLNKLVQVVKNLLQHTVRTSAHDCFEYSESTKYLRGDVCYVIHTLGDEHVISTFRRKSNNPTEIYGISPFVDTNQWELILSSDIFPLAEALAQKAPINVELTNDTASSILPVNGTVSAILQTIRNNLRHLFGNKVDKININEQPLAARKFSYNAQGQITGSVGLTKNDLGLGNVPNTDTTNAANINSGTLAVARLPNADLTASANNNALSDQPDISILSAFQELWGRLKHLWNNPLRFSINTAAQTVATYVSTPCNGGVENILTIPKGLVKRYMHNVIVEASGNNHELAAHISLTLLTSNRTPINSTASLYNALVSLGATFNEPMPCSGCMQGSTSIPGRETVTSIYYLNTVVMAAGIYSNSGLRWSSMVTASIVTDLVVDLLA